MISFANGRLMPLVCLQHTYSPFGSIFQHDSYRKGNKLPWWGLSDAGARVWEALCSIKTAKNLGYDCPTTIFPTQNGEAAFLAVVMSCNATAGFSLAVKRGCLRTEASQRILKVIDRIPKTSLKSALLDTSSSKGWYKIIIMIIFIMDNNRKN